MKVVLFALAYLLVALTFLFIGVAEILFTGEMAGPHETIGGFIAIVMLVVGGISIPIVGAVWAVVTALNEKGY